jgi:hypothetical protein
MKRFLTAASAAVLLAALTWTTLFYCNHTPPPVVEIYPALYVRLAAVYDGDFNGSMGATVSKEVLEAAAQSFANVPILLSHEHHDLEACVGRTVSAKLAYDQIRKQYYLEVIAKITSPAAITKIKNGLYHSVSVSFVVDDAICSIDNLNIRDCPHSMGKPYKVNGKWEVARAMLKHVTGLEISFVNIPGSAGARILNSSPAASFLDTSK